MGKLVLNDVSYQYRTKYQTVYAVNNVSHSFVKGKFYAIVGKSGSGKTTLLSIIAGLDLPTSGEVIYDGENIAKMNRDKYRLEKISMIYQNFNLFPLLTALENVMFPGQFAGKSENDAKQVAVQKIQSVGLNETFHNRFPSMLSGGEQQRIAIARALSTNADVILADEPTGNLDVGNSNNIVELLMKLAHEEDYCVIVVTHDLSIAEKADVVLKMEDGRIV